MPRFADKVWGIRKEDEKEAALAGIEATEAYFRAIGMPTSLTELGVDPSEEDLRELSLNATMNDTVKLSRLKPLGAEGSAGNLSYGQITGRGRSCGCRKSPREHGISRNSVFPRGFLLQA